MSKRPTKREVMTSPFLRKSHSHQKSKKAIRKREKQKLKKEKDEG